MLDQISQIETTALEALNAVRDTAALEAWRVAHLGRNSPLMSALGDLGKLPKEERPIIGQRGNQARRALEDAYAAKAEAERTKGFEKVDVTFGIPPHRTATESSDPPTPKAHRAEPENRSNDLGG